MSFASKRNPQRSRFGEIAKDLIWMSLAEWHKANPGKTAVVVALMINRKSKYGLNPVMVTASGMAVNLPRHLLKTVEDIIADDDDVAAINARKVGAKVREYTTSDGLGTGLSIEWVDL